MRAFVAVFRREAPAAALVEDDPMARVAALDVVAARRAVQAHRAIARRRLREEHPSPRHRSQALSKALGADPLASAHQAPRWMDSIS